MIFTSCQDEVTEITQPSNEETIAPNSTLATLMRNTATNDGSRDNILDYANCLEVELPVTVIANGVQITIDSEVGFDVIEAIFDEFDNDEDSIDFIFPITIISSNYDEIVIENQEALEELIRDCNGENEDDDDIECIDFQYPITISIYDTEFELIGTETINNDEALYDFIEDLDGGVLASINFPVTMILANGDTLVVENNTELEAAIEAAEDDCDEDDDYDWNDDDIEDCDVNLAELEAWLLECDIEAYFYGDNNIIDENYLMFNANGEVIVNGTPAVTEVGAWGLSESNDGYVLAIEGLQTFNLVNGNWLLLGCEEDEFIFNQETNSGNVITMELEQECRDNELDCTDLFECTWEIASYTTNPEFIGFEFHFYSSNEFIILQNNQAIGDGTWAITPNQDFIVIDTDFENVGGDWQIVTCSDDRLELLNNQNTMVLERDCSNGFDCSDLQANIGDVCFDNQNREGIANSDCECEVEQADPFECFDGNDFELEVCDDNNDGLAEFDLTMAWADCLNANDFTVTYHESLSDAQQSFGAIANPNNYTNASNPQTIYIRVELSNNSNEYEVFEIQLNVEDCSSSECSEQDIDAILLECIWNVVNFNGSGDLSVYDFDFNDDDTVVIEGEGMSVVAMWSTSESNDGVLVDFSGVSLPNIQAITGTWLVVECEEDRLQFTNDNNETFVMERDCR